ncbi:hypothetical protein [Aeoliella mucimassa]|uniref:Uncharacterized protein n=1 Tax=Aeoliella mucimassa TaxID=2527972 RepID=A0A518APB8_9BACT|nr:hypothetical protein [Aeoliella mucimassa]QDU56573.1 hypothetical protein Pan181_27830 [Aeoliella mucimassa]
MKLRNLLTYTCMAFMSCAIVVGCAKEPAGESKAPEHADAHEHPTEGPHHGTLIELGSEEYHAELVHDDANGTVTVYLLDAEAKVPVAISATEIMINLSHDGEAEQFSLSATPDATDPAGQASKFVSSDAELAADLDEGHAEAQLVVMINDVQFHGAVAHDHDHEL